LQKLSFACKGKTISATAVRREYDGTLYLFNEILFTDNKAGNCWEIWDKVLESIVPPNILYYCCSVRKDRGLFRLPRIDEIFGEDCFQFMKGKNRISTRISDGDIDWWWLDDTNKLGESAYTVGYGYAWSHFQSEKWGIRPLIKIEN